MKSLFVVFACTLQIPCMGAYLDWEQIYPEQVLNEKGEPLFQIGGRRYEYEDHELGEGQFFEQYLIGVYGANYLYTLHPKSDRTHLTYSWSLDTEMNPVEVEVPFIISAIASYHGEWILGGTSGEIALHEQGYANSNSIVSNWQNTDYGPDSWKLSSVGQAIQVQAITAIDGRLLALCEGSLFVSANGGLDWQKVVVPAGISDIEAHDGAFYALQATEDSIQLFQSPDGSNWQSVWSVFHGAKGAISSDLVVYDKDLNGYDRPMGTGKRLYVFLDVADQQNGHSTSLILSTRTGQTWHDHGSNRTQRDPETGTVHFYPWNPLELPYASRNLSAPEHDYMVGTLNMRVTEQAVQSYTGNEWKTRRTFNGILGFSRETLNQWGVMTFVSKRGDDHWLMTIHPDGEVSRELLDYNLPDKAFHYQQVVLNGKYYGILRDDPNWIVETEDFKEMSLLLPPEAGNIRKLMINGGKLVVHTDRWEPENYRGALAIWDGSSWSAPIPVAYGIEDVTYCEATGLWYTLEHVAFQDRYDPWSEEYHVNSVDMEGNIELVTVLYPQWGESFKNLSSPDQELILVYGYDEMAVVHPDGEVYYPELDEILPGAHSRISSIQYINGWYYLLHSRTRDFITFESINYSAVTGYNGDMYAFTGNAIYRRPLERGYLGSIQHPRGWYHADWFGWFQIIDQELGDIEHLILGSCWVKQTSDHEYWIQTPGLGWVYMNSDWSPWAYRLDDGHWYWLDLNGWPPRAWDDAESVWRSLQP